MLVAADRASASDRVKAADPAPSLAEATRVWAKIAFLSFGGPVGQIALMHRVLIDEKRWVTEPRFLHALNFCMLLPGPEAQQLATYLGWMMHGVRGGLVAGVLFIIPGAIAIMALSYLYVLLGHVPLVAAFFLGLKAAVIAIVIQAVIRIARRTLKTSVLIGIAAAAFAALFVFKVAFPWVVLAAGIVGLLLTFARVKGEQDAATPTQASAAGIETDRPGRIASVAVLGAAGIAVWWVPVLSAVLLLGAAHVVVEVGFFFSKMALVTFGGAYSVLNYVGQHAVDTAGWLSADQMLDGLGLAETTPGPLIMVVQFVGFLAGYHEPGQMTPLWAGPVGGLMATWTTFVPSILFVLVGAPFMEALRENRLLAGALQAVTAAVVGVTLNLALWFSLHVLFAESRPVEAGLIRLELPMVSSADAIAAVLVVLACILTFKYKASIIRTIGMTALAAIIIHLATTGSL